MKTLRYALSQLSEQALNNFRRSTFEQLTNVELVVRTDTYEDIVYDEAGDDFARDENGDLVRQTVTRTWEDFRREDEYTPELTALRARLMSQLSLADDEIIERKTRPCELRVTLDQVATLVTRKSAA